MTSADKRSLWSVIAQTRQMVKQGDLASASLLHPPLHIIIQLIHGKTFAITLIRADKQSQIVQRSAVDYRHFPSSVFCTALPPYVYGLYSLFSFLCVQETR